MSALSEKVKVRIKQLESAESGGVRRAADAIESVRAAERSRRGCLCDEDLAGLIDGMLSPARASRAEKHLAVCALCRIDAARLRSALRSATIAPFPTNSRTEWLPWAVAAALLFFCLPASFFVGRSFAPSAPALGPEKSIHGAAVESGLSAEDMLKWSAGPEAEDVQALSRAAGVFENYLKERPQDAVLRLRLVQFYERLRELAGDKEDAQRFAGLAANHRKRLPEVLRAVDPGGIEYANKKH